ncbi:L-type lectin-domain containing receptor kinase IX.1-like isoform X2 [Euphorbia lathyris]|uniref:L-type lectin-domain containing receptor kinase IX.1-like isoform X2 n=1 Tax=Euphorbia lathyris TaxID=212925 RepID=UPI00331406B9
MDNKIPNAKMLLVVIVVLIFLFGFPGFSHPLSFNYPDFPPETTDILFEGDATADNGAIRLIPRSSYSQYRVGKASYAKPFHLYDSSTGTTSNFVTSFSFRIDDLDLKLSDGFTFFLSSVSYPIPPNSAGAYLGLFNSTAHQNQIIVVEFDTISNSFDPPFSHIGINNGSITSSAYVNWDLSSTTGKEGHVWISYNATTKNLSVFCSYDSDRVYKGYSNVSYRIDLKEVLPEWVRVGFSAASGPNFEKNFGINTWRFDSDLDFVEETGSSRNENRKTKSLIGAAGLLFLLIVAGGFGYFLARKRSKSALRNSYMLVNMDLERRSSPIRFTLEELEIATNDFADHMKLGQGASGHVYKGTLSDICRLVAVKKISSTEYVNSEKLFINEIKVISRLMHRNLVQFIGWCHERESLLLVYDFMPNGSLDTHLFGKRRALPWQVRYRIAIGLASALHYLHEEAEQCVLHRDIKPANVLLDTDFSVKLGDFGVSKLVDTQFRTRTTTTTGVVGTWGYIAPEYAYDGKATKESDMYSFGIVALEIACGRRTIKDGEFHIPLVKWVWELYLAGNVIDAADEQLSRNFNREEMECLLKVGLWCSHPKAKERLKSGQVAKALRFEASLPELPIDTHDSICPAATSNLSQFDFMEVSSV